MHLDMTYIVCPQCGQEKFDPDAGKCDACHMRGSNGAVLDAAALEGLLYNVKVYLAPLPDDQFQQMAGAFGPTERGDDPILFDEETCQIVYHHLRANGVLCSWLEITADHRTMHSLVFAKGNHGLERGLKAAQKLTRKVRGRLIVRSERPNIIQ
jgi:hypothetical protein